MVKGLKPLIILGSVIVAMVLACYLFLVVFPAASDDAAEEETTSSTAASNVTIISENSADLLSFEVIPAEGDTFLVEYELDSEGDYTYTVTPAAPNFEYDTSKFRSMLYTLSSVSTTNVVEENAQDLSRYGLDEPAYTIRSTYTDKVIDIYIGNVTLVDNYYYVKTSLSDDVYTLGSYLVSLLTRGDMDYRQITYFPLYEDDEIYSNINWFRLTLRDGTVIEITHDEDLDGVTDATASEYYMSSPAETYCNSTTVQELLDDLALVESKYILGDVSDADLGLYGLDNPARMEMTDTSGNSVDILIGCKTAAGSSYYYTALSAAPNTVIVAGAEAFTWFEINYIELMNRVVWLYDITDISSIDYDLGGGVQHSITLEHSTKPSEVAEDTEINVVDATLDGEFLSESNARRMYVRSCNFRISGELTSADKAALSKTADYSITYNFNDGTSSTLELVKINDRQYACRVDGVATYYTNVKNITTLLSAFDTILSGGTLAMSYDSY